MASYVKNSIDKIRSKSWSAPAATAMKGTAVVFDALGNFVPGLGYIGGALKLGSSILNPDASLADIKKETELLTQTMEQCSGKTKQILQQYKMSTL